jgi:uncharacterized protein (TIGR02421 family)
LAGYDALQEGLAVLSEYLVGGLSRPRLRLLAGRVVAAGAVVDGASFVEVYRLLKRDHGFAGRTAFVVTMRVFRGGGLTKDMVYLQGLQQILEYVGQRHRLDPLYVGKIAVRHIPIIRELQWRGVLRAAPLMPSYLESDAVQGRLKTLHRETSIVELVGRSQR